MTLADVINFFDRQRGGTHVTDAFAREVVKTLREVERESERREQPSEQREAIQ